MQEYTLSEEYKKLLLRYCDLGILNTFQRSAIEQFGSMFLKKEHRLEKFIQVTKISFKDIFETYCRDIKDKSEDITSLFKILAPSYEEK